MVFEVEVVKFTSIGHKILKFGSKLLFMPIQSPIGIGIQFGKFEFPSSIIEANLLDIEIRPTGFRLRPPFIKAETQFTFLKFTLFEFGSTTAGFEKHIGPVFRFGFDDVQEISGTPAVEAPTTPKLKSGILISDGKATLVPHPKGIFFDVRQGRHIHGGTQIPLTR